MKPKNPKFSVFIFLAFPLFVYPTTAWASNKSSFQIEKCSRIQTGLSLGGNSYQDYNLSNPGFIIQHTYVLKPNKKYGVGFGLGFHSLQEFNLVPIYLDFIGFMSENLPFFLNMQTGYSVGWVKSNVTNESEFKGGAIINAGIGRRFRFHSGLSAFLEIDYRHQFSSITYTQTDAPSYKKNLNLDFIVISFGIMLEQK